MNYKIQIAVVERRVVESAHEYFKRSEGDIYCGVHGAWERIVMTEWDDGDFTVNQRYIIRKFISDEHRKFHDDFDDYESYKENQKNYEQCYFSRELSDALQKQLGEDFVVQEDWKKLTRTVFHEESTDINEWKDYSTIMDLLGEDPLNPPKDNTIKYHLESLQKKKLYKLQYSELNTKQDYFYYHHPVSGLDCRDLIVPQCVNLYPIDIALELRDYHLLCNLLRSGATKSDRIDTRILLDFLIRPLKRVEPHETNACYIEHFQKLSVENCSLGELEILYSAADCILLNLYDELVFTITHQWKTIKK